MKLKVLDKDRKSPIRDFQYEVETWYTCDDFDEDETVDCGNGFYATDVDGLPYTFRHNRDVWEVEISGKKVEIDQFKRRYEKLKLLKMIPHDEVKQLAIEWENEVGYKLSEVLFPVNPLLIERECEVTDKEIQLLKDWASVRASIWASVEASVGDSIWASIGDSIGTSIWDSVKASVWDSVGAYMGSLFPSISQWKYIEHKDGEYPFQPAVDLWYAGLVPSYDGKAWRLHAGEDATILFTS